MAMMTSNGSKIARIARFICSQYVLVAATAFTALLLFLLLSVMVQRSSSLGALTNPIVEKYGPIVYKAYPQWKRQDVDLMLREAWLRENNFVYDSFCQFKERPRKGRYVNVSDDGYRQSYLGGNWPPSGQFFNVFVFGGSTTFGYGVPDGQTIPSCLARFLEKLQKEAPQQVRPFRVYNFGRGYFASSQERALFEKLVVAGYLPDLAVFIDGANEQFNERPRFTSTLEQLMKQTNLQGEWSWNTPLKSWLGRQKGLFPQAKVNVLSNMAPKYPPDERRLSNYFANQRIIRAISTAFSVPVVFVWQPVPRYLYNYKAYDLFAFALEGNSGDVLNELMNQHLSENVATNDFLNLAAIQQDIKRNLYVDTIHYTGDFCNVIAEKIAKFCADHNMFHHPKQASS